VFSSISYSLVGGQITVDAKLGDRPIHVFARVADFVSAIAFIIIGALATQYGFLSQELQYAFIGAGSAYTILNIILLGSRIKHYIAPNVFMIPLQDHRQP
jgi:hypothetical protein